MRGEIPNKGSELVLTCRQFALSSGVLCCISMHLKLINKESRSFEWLFEAGFKTETRSTKSDYDEMYTHIPHILADTEQGTGSTLDKLTVSSINLKKTKQKQKPSPFPLMIPSHRGSFVFISPGFLNSLWYFCLSLNTKEMIGKCGC